MSLFEQRLRAHGYLHIAGVDEAGQGPLVEPTVNVPNGSRLF
ncbi:MAG: hypothetical protein HW387_1790 [Parachlamydiales bacterium]|nr:hypothetical protein [Parachlamydiales bacterium]